MREEDLAADLALRVGDVLLGHEGTPLAPSGEMFYCGSWEKISLEAFAVFLIVDVNDQNDEYVHVELVSLISAIRIEMALYRKTLGDAITVVRGGRVVPDGERGKVLL